MPWGETAHEQQAHEQIEVGGHRLAIHGECTGERRGVEQPSLLMREHRPEATQRLGRDARPELRDIALEVRPDEIGAPAQALPVGRGKQALGKAAAEPERVESLAARLAGIERGEFQVADAPGRRLARLLEQIDRRRAEDEKASLDAPAPPAGVDESPQGPEELRRALDLVQDDELLRVLREVQLGRCKLGAVGLGLEIQIDRRPSLGHFEGERGLAHLARAKERHGRGFGQGGGERGEEPAVEHSCNCGATLQKCKD